MSERIGIEGFYICINSNGCLRGRDDFRDPIDYEGDWERDIYVEPSDDLHSFCSIKQLFSEDFSGGWVGRDGVTPLLIKERL